MSRASDYVIALRTSASGTSSKAASNSYVTIVKNAIDSTALARLANTNSYIAATAASGTTTGKAIAMAIVFG